ncbi:cellulose biosynthesis protein BcsD [Pantoea osteomyelitidis]|uniref:Cellulose biosynthesis protein BcsD n=1 Tax=Pantoea osteomyelitidis TaxID=3230026 RepID=A0ABW7PR07_9GAMM
MNEQISVGHLAHPYQPGWFDLLSVMIDGMMANAGEEEAAAFLRVMGESLAARYPLPEARTVQDLEREMNLQLARFNWGFVLLQPQDRALLIQHHALPVGGESMEPARWQSAMSAVLNGLFAGWLRGQGGSPAVPVALEMNDGNVLLYRYQ